MGVLLVLAKDIVHSFESISTRACSKKHGNGGLAYNAIICFFALCVSIITGLTEGLNFPAGIWVYGIISGFFYLGGFYFAFLAFQDGPFTIIKLISTFGMLTGIIYGIIARDEKMTVILAIGIVLIFVAIFLTNSAKSDAEQKTSGSKKWLLYTFIFVLCNAGITVISLLQQDKFYIINENGSKIPTCNTEFLIISFATAFIALMVTSLVKDSKKTGGIFKKCLPYGIAAGAFNAISNMLNLEANRHIEQTVKIPLGTGISLAIGFILGFVLYKERFAKKQLCGFAVGVVAIALLLAYNILK